VPDRYRRVSAAFVAETRRRFAFLTGQGFAEVASADTLVRYGRGGQPSALDVAIRYDDWDGRVITHVAMAVEGWTANAELSCLYVAAGLGPAQHIRDIVRSPRLLPVVLDTHAEALRRLLPVLVGERGRALVRECHGR
jgi:hypothetical protein